MALKTHPDKNMDDPSVTSGFQEVPTADDVLQHHVDRNTYSDAWTDESGDISHGEPYRGNALAHTSALAVAMLAARMVATTRRRTF